MKRLLIYLPMLLLTACGRETDPGPQIAGTYEMTHYTTPGPNGVGTVTYVFPYTNPQNNQVYTGSVNVVRQTDSRIGVVYTIGIKGRAQVADSLQLSVRLSGGKFDLLDGSTKVGTVDGTNFDYDSRTQIGTNTLQFVIKAKK